MKTRTLHHPSRHRRLAAVLAGLSILLAACGTTSDLDAETPQAPVGETTPDDTTDVDDPADDDPADPPAAGPTDPAEDPAEDPADDGPAAPSTGERTGPATGDCSASGVTVTPRPAGELPAAVVAARDFLLDAALRCDEQLLHTAIDESSMFTFSFGADTDAIGYWWDLEEAGEQPYRRLAEVLATTPALAESGEVYVWPRVTTGRSVDTTEEAWTELTWLDDPLAMAAQGDGYLDWRVGISTEGEWRFFVRGD